MQLQLRSRKTACNRQTLQLTNSESDQCARSIVVYVIMCFSLPHCRYGAHENCSQIDLFRFTSYTNVQNEINNIFNDLSAITTFTVHLVRSSFYAMQFQIFVANWAYLRIHNHNQHVQRVSNPNPVTNIVKNIIILVRMYLNTEDRPPWHTNHEYNM